MLFVGCGEVIDFINKEIENEEQKIIEYKDGYEIAKHENFSDIESFEERKIYLEGEILSVDDNDIYLIDEEGYKWMFTMWSGNHDFSKFIRGKM